MHWTGYFLLYTVNDQNNKKNSGTWFMNCDSISADFSEDINKNVFLLFLDKITVVLDYFILQDKHNICTLSENVKFICTRYKAWQKSSPKTGLSTHFSIDNVRILFECKRIKIGQSFKKNMTNSKIWIPTRIFIMLFFSYYLETTHWYM
jgi:hypothetical protein